MTDEERKELFANLIRGYMYGANYRVLQEMGADNKILKAFEKYQNASFPELKKAGEFVAAWQQARIAEMTKDGYLEAKRQQEQAIADFDRKQNIGLFEKMDEKKILN